MIAERLRGGGAEDAWGRDPGFERAVAPLLDALYARWWRVRTTGAASVPASGAALVAANHSGSLPWDALMIATALRREHPSRREARLLVDERAFGVPWASVALRRCGAVPATTDDAARLLAEGHVVVAFPEGPPGAARPWSRRHRLERFGRTFLDVALRTGAPLVPCAVVGGEEAHPRLGEVPGLARLLHLPSAPLTVPVPLPARWSIGFCPALDVGGHAAAAAEDPAHLLELADEVRAIVQDKVFEILVNREGMF